MQHQQKETPVFVPRNRSLPTAIVCISFSWLGLSFSILKTFKLIESYLFLVFYCILQNAERVLFLEVGGFVGLDISQGDRSTK